MSGDARQCRWHALECVRLAHTLSLRRSKRCILRFWPGPGSTQSRCGYPSGRSEWQTVSIAVRTAAAKAPKDRVLLDGAIKLDLTPLVISSWTPRLRRPRLQIFLVFVPCRSRSSSMLVVIPAALSLPRQVDPGLRRAILSRGPPSKRSVRFLCDHARRRRSHSARRVANIGAHQNALK